MAETQNARRLTPPAWLVAWGLSLLFLALAASIPEPLHHLEYLRIANPRGVPLWIIVYRPEPLRSSRGPAAVICQPFNSAPEYGRLLALELLQDGFVVATFDWRGRAREENRQLMGAGAREILRADVAAAVAYLRGLREVDPERIAVAGHSVGGTLAIEAASEDPRIAAVASIGMEADVTPERPRNLLWAPGLYDEFRVLNHMREVFQSSAATAEMEGTTVGDFARGTARRLGVSPTADHFTELQDRNIHREVRDWFRRAAGLPPTSRRLWMETRQLLFLLAGFTALVAAWLSLRRFARDRTIVLRLVNTAALAGVVLLARFGIAQFLVATSLILWLLVFTLPAAFLCSRTPEALENGVRGTARVLAVLWASLFLTLVVNNFANYVHEPRYLLWLPEFALRHALDGLYAYLVVGSRPILSSLYDPQRVEPRLWVYALLGLEAVKPGWLIGLAARAARSRQALGAATQRTSLVGVVVLACLLIFLAAVVGLRIRQGFLTAESALAALRFLVRFTVLPIFIFALVWRRSKRLAMT